MVQLPFNKIPSMPIKFEAIDNIKLLQSICKPLILNYLYYIRGSRPGLLVTTPLCQTWFLSFESALDPHMRIGLLTI